eukprot:4220984-Prorocentrum_lima.AAC.1
MTSSLVGSEMCIRDRKVVHKALSGPWRDSPRATHFRKVSRLLTTRALSCLLYTSDAADDM